MKEEAIEEDSDSTTTVIKKKSRAKTTFKCKVCKNVYSKELHASHMATHSGKHKCHICQNEFGTRKYMLRHVRNVHTEKKYKYKCSVCDKCFAFDAKRKSHEMVHTGEKPYECEECGKCFRAQYCYKMHLLVHSDEKPFKCVHCPYACRDSSTLRKHQDRHTGKGPLYQCAKCDKKYKVKWRLKTHIAEEHLCLNVRLTECDQCDKKFKNRSQLSAHVRSVHERAKVAKCEICDKYISNYANMPAHLRTHTSLKPYRCPEPTCEQIFRTPGDAKKHSVIHYPRRKTPCLQCGRRFARVSALRRHELTQHKPKIKNTACEICGAKFYNDNYLLKHLHQKHSSFKERYECDHCGLVTMNKPSIVMHLKYGHGNEKDLKCKMCKRQYKKHVYLKMHYLKTHNLRYKPIQRKKPKAVEVEVPIKEEPLDIVEHDLEGALENAEIVNAEDIAPLKRSVDCSSPELSESVANTLIADNVAALTSLPENVFDEFFIKHLRHDETEPRVKVDREALEQQRIEEEREVQLEEARQNAIQERLDRARHDKEGAGQNVVKEKTAGKVPVFGKRQRRIYRRCELLLSCDICDREFRGLAALKGHSKMHSSQSKNNSYGVPAEPQHYSKPKSKASELKSYKSYTSQTNSYTSEPQSNTSEPTRNTSEPTRNTSEPKSSTGEQKSYTSEQKSYTSEQKSYTSEQKSYTSEPTSNTSETKSYTSQPKNYTSESKSYTSQPKNYTSEPISYTSELKRRTSEPISNASELNEVKVNAQNSDKVKKTKRQENNTENYSKVVAGHSKLKKSRKGDKMDNLKEFYELNVKDLGVDFEQFVKICKKVKKDGSSE